jgi:translation initiation factor 5A
MVKLISGVEARSGTTILVDGVACVVRSNDISKTGKHGHAKCRIEAMGVIDGKKRVFVMGGHERIDVPNVNKNKAQVLNIIGEDKASVMDLESFETIEIPMMEELKGELKEEDQIEYWDIEGIKIIKRKL